MARLLELHAQKPMRNQCQEAHQRKRADAPPQAVVDRCDLDVALEPAKALLIAGQALVARDGGGRIRLGVGLHQQLVVQPLEGALRLVVDAEADELAAYVHLDGVRQPGVLDGVVQTRLRA